MQTRILLLDNTANMLHKLWSIHLHRNPFSAFRAGRVWGLSKSHFFPCVYWQVFFKSKLKMQAGFYKLEECCWMSALWAASKILLLSLPGTNDTLLWPVPFWELQSESPATVQEQENNQPPFSCLMFCKAVPYVVIAGNKVCFFSFFFFATFDNWLHSLF